jgi:ABC-type multidrug transport system ATPase subunit
MLEVSDVTKYLGGRRVLDGLTLSCAGGEVCAVLGENGAGKSTLLRVVSGMIAPDAGRVVINGELLEISGPSARRQLGYAPDASEALPDLLVAEFVSLVRALKRVGTGERLEADFLAWRERLGLAGIWDQRLSTLSFGQRKRACTLAALVGDPWLLILDEPSNGLDPAGVDLMVGLIESRQTAGKATLLASNDRPFVSRLRARHYLLHQGKVAESGCA